MPRIVVAVPTLVGGDPLVSCVRALSRQTCRDFEVIVINNASGEIADEIARHLENEFPDFPLRILTPGVNIGFGAAVNLAASSSAAPLVAVLNDDTEPDPAWLATLVAATDSDPAIGMCASRIQLYGTDRLDSAGMLICGDGSSKQRGQWQPSAAWPNSSEALFPSGCAALYRREIFDSLGAFDEDFFLYCEDTDLGLRAQWAGWRCIYVAGAVVHHHYSLTAGGYSPLKARFVERNRLWVAIKNFPLSLLIRVPIVSIARYRWQLIAVRHKRGAASGFVRSGSSILGGLWHAFRILAAAHWETLIHLPSLLRKRADFRSRRRISSAEFITLLERHRITPKELAYFG